MAESYGLGDAIHDPKGAEVDIVFVHGLGGHRIGTWTSEATEEVPITRFWPKDFLPNICPLARILSFGYNASFAHFYPLYGPKNISVETTIDDHSAALFLALRNYRSTTKTPSDRPIIFVAHSLGGLVCANALSRQHGPNESNFALVKATCGICFLGTPFEGSEKARWGSRGLQLVQLVSSTNVLKMKDLEERSQKLASINDSFYKLLKARDQSHSPLKVACFFEEYPTYILRKSIDLIVPKSSASLAGIDPISIAASHRGMCRFAREDMNGYRNISETLSQWAKNLDELPTANQTQSSLQQGSTHYYGEIKNNKGIVMGNAYGRTKDAIRVVGSKTTNYYGMEPKRGKDPGDDDNDD